MTIDKRVRDKKLQYDVNKIEVAKIFALSSTKQISKDIHLVKKYYQLINID